VASTEDLERPWLRQPFDTDVEWTWFQEYLGLAAPRRLVTIARRDGCPWSWQELRDVAEASGWELRAQAWDAYLDGVRVKEIERQVQETAAMIGQRHVATWKRAFHLLGRELEKLTQQSVRADAVPILQPRDLLRGLDLATKAERLLMGEATQRTETQQDFSRWSTEDLAQLRDLMARNGGG
jgi:hypothetical protein